MHISVSESNKSISGMEEIAQSMSAALPSDVERLRSALLQQQIDRRDPAPHTSIMQRRVVMIIDLVQSYFRLMRHATTKRSSAVPADPLQVAHVAVGLSGKGIPWHRPQSAAQRFDRRCKSTRNGVSFPFSRLTPTRRSRTGAGSLSVMNWTMRSSPPGRLYVVTCHLEIRVFLLTKRASLIRMPLKPGSCPQQWLRLPSSVLRLVGRPWRSPCRAVSSPDRACRNHPRHREMETSRGDARYRAASPGP